MHKVARLSCLALLAAICGCKETSAPSTSAARPAPKRTGGAASTQRSTAAQQSAARAAKPSRSFASVEAALGELRSGLADGDQQRIGQAEQWLAQQREQATAPLAELLQAEGTPFDLRITVCRVLGKVGPSATDVLITTSAAPDQPEQLRRKAIESLSRIRPSNDTIVAHLLDLAQTGAPEIRQAAIQGLGRIGPPAKAATELLVQLLTDLNEDDVLRGDAQRALREIDPRRGLMGVAEPQPQK